MNKTAKILVFLVVIVGIGLLYAWYNSSIDGQEEKKSVNSENISNTNEEIPLAEIASLPRIIITSPKENEHVYSEVVIIQYQLSGNGEEVSNIDLTLSGPDNQTQHFVSSLDRGVNIGRFPLINLEQGDYNLIARLRSKDGNFYNHNGSVALLNFVKERTGQSD